MVALNEELDEIAEEPQARCGCGAAEGAMTFPPKNQSNPRSVPYCSDSYLLDSDSSRHYARNRNYSPSLGRWINQDPAGYINGANTYQFVESDPVNAVDPTGTIAWYYWAAAGGVDILGGGPEDPLADAVDAGILGAGEAAATEDAAQLAAQQAAREAALKAAQTTALWRCLRRRRVINRKPRQRQNRRPEPVAEAARRQAVHRGRRDRNAGLVGKAGEAMQTGGTRSNRSVKEARLRILMEWYQANLRQMTSLTKAEATPIVLRGHTNLPIHTNTITLITQRLTVLEVQ